MPRSGALILFAAATLALTPALRAHEPAEEMAEAARRLAASLTPEQRAKINIEFASDERMNFHYTPVTRRGLPLKEMTTTQRHLAYALLSTALSQRGFMKAAGIMALETTLGEIERSGSRRDAENYFVTLFGTPGGKDPWGWRWEGHHLSLNFTIAGTDVIALTPEFMGANPARVPGGPLEGVRLLEAEEELGRKLLLALDDAQRREAVFSARAPREIITEESRAATLPAPAGIAMSKLNDAQRALLLTLIREHAGRFRSELAEAEMARLARVPPEQIFFGWAGPAEPGALHYYRIQGPQFIIEYDNVQNGGNHIHTVWRDTTRDFGRDPLREHYLREHATAAENTATGSTATAQSPPENRMTNVE